MVNILVPTDLSDLSKIAAQYAIKISNKLDGTVTLLYVNTIAEPVRHTMRERVKLLEKELAQNAQEDLDQLVKSLSKNVKFTQPIAYRVVRGSSFNETVKKEAKKLRAGLIIMGTHGASGIKKVVMGSNTASMIGISSIPVLAVPENADFKGFRNMVYATDLNNLDKELKLLIPYVEKFGSTIHIVHVTSSGKNVPMLEKKMDTIIEKAEYKKIVSMVLVDADVDKALDQYVELSKADVLAMFTHEPTFFEKLFDRSITRRMAFHSKIPLLAFKQKK